MTDKTDSKGEARIPANKQSLANHRASRLWRVLSFVTHLRPASRAILAAIEALLLGVTIPVLDGFLVRKEARGSITSR